jgi:hypothetical protein
MPNVEGFRSSVSSTFFFMSLVLGFNLATLLMLVRIFYPIDLKGVNKLLIVTVVFLPPFIFNYMLIYHRDGYKKIMKEFDTVKKGSLKYLGGYLLTSIALWLIIGYFVQKG